MNPNPWDRKPLSPAELARLGELVSRPIIEPPWIDVGEVAIKYPSHFDDEKIIAELARRLRLGGGMMRSEEEQ